MSAENEGFDNFWRDRLKEYPQTEEFQRLFDELKGELKVPQRRLSRPVVVSLIGIPGSGKSTFSTILQEFIPACHLRSDTIGLHRLPKGADYDYYKAYVIQEALARHYLTQGYSVIMDDNNRTKYNREQTYKLAQSYNALNLLFRLDSPFNLALERTQTRDREEGREIHSDSQMVNILLMFQKQIEEPDLVELERFQVFYKKIDIGKSLSQIRAELKVDIDLQSLVS